MFTSEQEARKGVKWWTKVSAGLLALIVVLLAANAGGRAGVGCDTAGAAPRRAPAPPHLIRLACWVAVSKAERTLPAA